MALGYLPGRICDLYRECYTDNSSAAAFAKYRDVHREAQPALVLTGGASSDSWFSRVRHFLKGLT